MSISVSIKEMESKLRRVMPTLPILAGNEVVNFAKDRFRFSNWRGNSIKPWKKRASKHKKDKGRAILVQSGRLKRSIRVTQRSSTMVAVGSDVPYAKIHNEGGTIHQAARSDTFKRNRYQKGTNKGLFKRGTTAGQGFTFKKRTINMPQRQILGSSPWLTKKIGLVLTKTIMKALR